MMEWNMEWIFWVSVALVTYTYVVYPLLVAALARWWPRPIRRSAIQPSVTLIIAAYNEEATIADKLENTLALDYPKDRLEILVAADGSSDRTAELVRHYATRGVRLIHRPARQGKTAALNRTVAESRGDVLVFSDANTVYSPNAISLLVRNFADPQVGGVSGRKVVLKESDRQATDGETTYWGYESQLKTWESCVHSVVTADGEIFAMRRRLYDFPASDIVHDDMYLTVSLVRRGFRVVYEPEATSGEPASRSLVDEFHLKVRYASAGYQIVSRFPRLLLTPSTWFACEFISHKLLRWLAPVFLLLALATSGAIGGPFYTSVFSIGIAVIGAALAGWCLRAEGMSRLLYFSLYFVLMNIAALYGLARYVSVGQTTHWRKAVR